MPLFPKEHGAYGQVLFPLIAAFAVAGPSTAGVLVAAAVAAGFLAHEPALVVLGHRGARAKREIGRAASRWLTCWALAGTLAGIGALVTIEPPARWSLAVPLVPAVLLAAAAVRGAEKSWFGETAAALAFAGGAFPIAMAGGLPLSLAATVAIPFALLFVSSTLAVRVVILRVRGGGDARAVRVTRRAALALASAGTALLVILAAAEFVAVSAIAAASPGLLTAAAIAIRPPSPTRLRTVGWTLVGISLLTTALVVTTIR
jgi:hypothetical protein